MSKDWDAWGALGIASCLFLFLLGLGLVNVGSELASLSYRESDDLAAQQSMASAAWAMFYVALAQATISIGTIVGIALAFLQGRRQLNDNRRAAEVQSQAYVHAEKAEWGSWGNVLVYCKNTGQTPATHFSVAATAYLARRGAIESSLRYPNDGHKTWSTLPANTERSVSLEFPNVDELKQFRRGLHQDDEILVVVGSIIYCTVFNEDHVTHFAFYVDQISYERFRRPSSKSKAYWKVPGQNGTAFRRQFPSAWDQ